ncbi:MAG TPA: hypothetical protein VFC46_07860 [Humisphaera sp.]|nr:hypothetical protein [Humisphaera sp.]
MARITSFPSEPNNNGSYRVTADKINPTVAKEIQARMKAAME